MTLKNHLKKIITGLTIPQEYVCLNSPELQYPLSVFVALQDENLRIDVSSSNLFLGYKPLILALRFKVNDSDYRLVKSQNQIYLRFENSEPIKPTILGQLTLKKIEEKVVGENAVLFYEGVHGEHEFLNARHQWINQQSERLRKQTPNNVSLPGNLIEQVRIAYSVPRIISMITLSDGTLMNMFPTDLHGLAGEKIYTGSLRLGGLANKQIEKYKQIVISEVEPSFYRQAYTLGKNHMRELQKESEFSLHSMRSKNLDFPLPSAVTSYRELRKIDSFDNGIHRIHIYEIIHQQMVQVNKSPLTHIHQYYAQWRLDNSFDTAMLLR